ncbi:OPT family small oligopeptide transporter [Allomyces macrogynus ATCC 38327]|uniref:OPT family small oligopeptide transporter n=1 Tax=Allomyces macrogynus (strain ATCC 38327) TaxID=578462 RepID=A0A0L0S6I2_ALLM3|nr:OPT family small oligopeptide transporter [Allomyces macrogynus ATCC 38327]|eukprot:KNE58040.1 OPT family small oligopeptide transporter [Allomyces macrogynus ATCC 38327]
MTVSEKPIEKGADAKLESNRKESSFVIDSDFENVVSQLAPRTDDTTTPSLTFRVWVLGTLFCVLLGVMNQLFSFRTNSFGVSSYVAVLLAYPLGVLMARTIPAVDIKLGPLGSFNLNPGPFSVKEHVLIGIFGSTGASGIYGTDNLVVQKLWYELEIGPVWSILFLFASSTLGFGISGISRKFLIRPAHMIWPSVLPSVALYSTFHSSKNEDVDSNGVEHMSRMKVFGIGALGMAVFHLLGPGFVSPLLQYLPILCWIAPASATIAQQVGSPVYGTGVLSLTLDWTTIGSGSMSIPFWSAANQFVSYLIFMWLITPLNVKGNWFNQPKPSISINSSKLMNNVGKAIGAAKLVDKSTNTIRDDIYEANRPIYLSPFFAWSYFGSMATFMAAVSHTIVWYGKDIWARFRASQHDQEEDIHCQLIDKYPEVPDTWYYAFFAITTVLTIVVCHFSGIQMVWYWCILAIIVSVVGTVPIAVVLATSGVALYMNVISEFIIGIILPGKPVVMMAFKTLGVTVSLQCLTLLSDLKLGHYMKIAPRHVFIAQVFSQVLAVFVCWGTMEGWIASEEHVQWILDNGKAEGTGATWGATGFNIFYNASLIWGAIGPIRFFFESIYSPIIIGGLIAGAVTPIIFKIGDILVGSKVIPWHLFQSPLLYTVGSPGSNQGYVLTSFLISLFFQKYMFTKHQAWWKRYNYVLATSFDVGAALLAIIITFGINDQGVTMPAWALNPQWLIDGDDPCWIE